MRYGDGKSIHSAVLALLQESVQYFNFVVSIFYHIIFGTFKMGPFSSYRLV